MRCGATTANCREAGLTVDKLPERKVY